MGEGTVGGGGVFQWQGGDSLWHAGCPAQIMQVIGGSEQSETPVPTRGHHLLWPSGLGEEPWGSLGFLCEHLICIAESLQLTNLLEMQPTLCTLRAGVLSLIPGEERSEGGGGVRGHQECVSQMDSLTRLWATLFGEGCPPSSQGPGFAQLTEFAVIHLCKRCHLGDC